MKKYVKRLMKCNYSKERAESVCYDMWKNCGYVALNLFVDQIESNYRNVD